MAKISTISIHNYAVFILISLSLFYLNTDFLWAAANPKLNNGKKWRIAYYEGGPFSDYTDTMRTFVKALAESGWIQGFQEAKIPEIFDETPKPYWSWLSRCSTSFLSFNPDDAYSAGWDDSRRKEIQNHLMKKLKSGKIDIVIAMGTWAGQDLANNEHSVPTMVLSTSDPIKAGIIKNAHSSGYDHVTARVDPARYLRQLRMFHRIAGFKSLGIAYENTPDGKIYAAFQEVHQIAGERGFKVISCEIVDSNVDVEKSDALCMECYRRLAREADAVYLTAPTCVDRLTREIAEVFKKAKVPSFSMMGSKFVRQGIMFSISSDSGYSELGRYNAMKFGEILNGAKPVTLKQIFEDPLDIAVNMQTAREIGFNIPKSIIRIASEIYE